MNMKEEGNKRSVNAAHIVIWSGIVLGNIEWVFDILFCVYARSAYPTFSGLGRASIIFCSAQPLWFLFMYVVYIGSHNDIDSGEERCKMIQQAAFYTFGQWWKVLGGVERVHEKFAHNVGLKEPFHLLTLENCFKTQIVIETLLQTLPQMIIISEYSN